MDNIVLHGLSNPLRPLLDKTTLLHPDRRLMYSYFDNYNNPIKNVMCSFGCVYSCPYCYSKKYKEMYNMRTSEIRPVGSIINEVSQLKKYPLDLVFF
jgi:MoaA/NifB/PqqE/SkfB family radical SAM enzyme